VEGVKNFVTGIYTLCLEKKRPRFFLHNFYKCRHSYIIFVVNHPEDSFC